MTTLCLNYMLHDLLLCIIIDITENFVILFIRKIACFANVIIDHENISYIIHILYHMHAVRRFRRKLILRNCNTALKYNSSA